MQVNDLVEQPFRVWVIAILLSNGHYPIQDIISDGAENFEVSRNAVTNYLTKMLSRMFGILLKERYAGKGLLHVYLKDEVRRAIEDGALTPMEAASPGVLERLANA